MARSDCSTLLPGFLAKMVRASQLWSRGRFVFPHLTNGCTVRLQSQKISIMEVDESIHISGLPERNGHGSVRCRGNVTKYKRAFRFITCKPP